MTDSLALYARCVESYVHENAALQSAVGAEGDRAMLLEPLGEGEHNVNFSLTVSSHNSAGEEARTYVVRVNVLPQPFHACQIRYEYDALTAVEPSGCTPKPVFVDSSEDAPGKGVLVETFCPGHPLDFDHLSADDLARTAHIMADIHAVTPLKGCPLHRPQDPLCALYAECLERFDLYRSSAYEDARITRWVDRFCALTEHALDAAGPADGIAHIVNTEPLASHFLLPEGDRAGFFVDWERPILGEVAQDLAFFLAPTTTFWDSEYLFPTAHIDNYLRTYWDAVDGRFERGSFDARFPAWMKVSVLRAIAWCCKALIRYGDSSERQTSKAAAKIPVYLSDGFLEMILRECFAD